VNTIMIERAVLVCGGTAGDFAGLGGGALVVCGDMGLSSRSRDKPEICRNLPRVQVSAKVLSRPVKCLLLEDAGGT
jgi:hypothetical protein